MVNFVFVLLYLLKIFVGYFLPALGTLDLLSAQGRSKYGSSIDEESNKSIYYWLFLLHAEFAYKILGWMMPGTDVAVYLLLVEVAALIVFELKSKNYLIPLGNYIVAQIKNLNIEKYVDIARNFVFKSEAKLKDK
jgi:hypothetical protein